MEKKFNVLQWALSVIFILGGFVGILNSSMIAGILCLLSGISICPSLRTILGKPGIYLKRSIPIAMSVVLFLLATSVIGCGTDQTNQKDTAPITERSSVTEKQSEHITETLPENEPISDTQTEPPTEKITEAPVSEIAVHITNTGNKYHSSSCRYLKNSDSEVSLNYAKSIGLSPCGVCDPPQ